jgi:hypothetical protein
MRNLAYTAALLATLGLLLAPTRPAHSQDTRVHLGAHLPRWSAPVEENRFRSPWNWEQTITWVNRNYNRNQFPRIRVVNMPGVKAIHLANRTGRGDYSGINIYEMSNGEVRFYVLPRPESN